MKKIKERGKTYALHKASDKLNDYYGSAMLNVVQFDGHDIQCAYIDGYLQAEQDLEVKEDVVSTDTLANSLKISRNGNPRIEAMKEALRMEYEKGRADAIAEMQKEQTKEYLEGVKRVQNYKELTKFEKGFDRIAEIYAHRKNKDGYNKPWYTKERAAEMLYWAKEELGIFNEQ